MFLVLIHPLNRREKYTAPLNRIKTWVSFFDHPSLYPSSPLAVSSFHKSFPTPTAKLLSWVFPSYQTGDSLYPFLSLLLFPESHAFPGLFFPFWGGFILQLLPKKSWMRRKCFFFYLRILLKLGYLWYFGWKLFSPRILKMLIQLLSIFHFVVIKPSVTLINNTAHGIYFFSLEVFRIFSLFLEYRNFTQKIYPFSSHLLFWRLNGTFQSGNTCPLWFFGVIFVC